MNIKKRSEVIFIWSISYILIMMIPLIFVIVNFSLSKNSLEAEAHKVNELIISNMAQKIENNIIQNEKISKDIAYDVNRKLTNQGTELDFTIIKEMNLLLSKLILNSNIENIYIFLKDFDLVIFPNGNCSLSQYYDSYLSRNMTFDEFNLLVSADDNAKMVSILQNDREYKDVVYFRSIKAPVTNQYVGKIAVFNGYADFLQMSTNDSIDFECFVYDNENNYLIGTNDELEQKIHNLTAGKNNFVEKFDGTKYLVSSVKMRQTNFTFTVVRNLDIILESLNKQVFYFYICIISSILVGGVSIYFCIKYNYRPIKAIEKLIYNNLGDKIEKTNNAYKNIEKSMDYVILEKNRMQRIVVRQENMLLGMNIAKLIKGQNTDKELSMKIPDCASYYVLIAYIEKNDELFFDKNVNIDKDFEEAQLIAGNAICECFKELCEKTYPTIVDDNLVILLCMKDLVSKNDMTQALVRSAEINKNIYDVKVNLVVGGNAKSILQIHESYIQAQELLEYKLIYAIEDVYFYDEVDFRSFSDKFYYPYKKEELLINCIKQADVKKANDIVEELFEKNFTAQSINIKLVKYFISNIVNTVTKILHELSDLYGKDFDDYIMAKKPIERLSNCTNIDELKNAAHIALNEIAEFVQNKKENIKDNKAKIFKEYIDSHYRDEDLNISILADKLNLNRDYISKIFKATYNISILDYIHTLRIEKACEILKNGDVTVAETAKMVGYYNISTFLRQFSKIKGTTPKFYMETEKI